MYDLINFLNKEKLMQPIVVSDVGQRHRRVEPERNYF